MTCGMKSGLNGKPTRPLKNNPGVGAHNLRTLAEINNNPKWQ